jgi:uncharacterized protein YhdP
VAPLRKSAPEAMALRIERIPQGTERDELRVTLGRMLAVRLERQRAQGELRIARGVLALNEAPNLPERGILVLATLPRLDLEAWSALLASDAPAPNKAAPASGPQIDLIALRTAELVVMGRTFRNVTLGASRTAEGGLNANVASDNIVGYLGWSPGPAADPQSMGQVTARLTKLTIPASRKEDVVEVLRSPPKQIPELEVSVEQFELGSVQLGRLDLVAQNVGTGPASAWHIQKLDVGNADMKLASSGEWAPAAKGGRRMQMKFTFDTRDAGATLGRLGYPNTMAAGQGGIEGNLQWVGTPFDIDYPTLAGKLALKLDTGRFLKVETGNAARLLSLLSLQSLSRTLAIDGGRQFAEGFAFSSIRADAVIANGVISTENFRMTGASAAVLMSGTVDLRSETQQLHIVVLPEIDASTAALALGVANPVLGLGTYLAQLVLRDPLSKAFALEYDVAGSWTEPKVTRRSRVTPPSPESAK